MRYLNTDCPHVRRVCVDGFGMLKCKKCPRREEMERETMICPVCGGTIEVEHGTHGVCDTCSTRLENGEVIETDEGYASVFRGSPTQDEIDQAIKSCVWRGSMGGVDICNGNISPCMKEIKAGRCDVLKRLFAKYREVSRE